MEEMYGLQSTVDYSDMALMSAENLIPPMDCQSLLSSGAFSDHGVPMTFGSDVADLYSAISTAPEFGSGEEDILGSIKAKIASHPSYPRLIDAYIDCQKVGATPEIASFLEEIRLENDLYKRERDDANVISTCIGADPELDEFMEAYWKMLVNYKSDLSRPFDEATTFLNKIERQLSNLCITTLSGAVSSEEELSRGILEVQEAQARDKERDIKARLSRRFGSHIGKLNLEFSKKKKIGKLPKEARKALLHWWSVHYKWPYPTEADKISLAASTGLNQRQICIWFGNQRKRHWRPSENMQVSVMDSLSGPYFADG